MMGQAFSPADDGECFHQVRNMPACVFTEQNCGVSRSIRQCALFPEQVGQTSSEGAEFDRGGGSEVFSTQLTRTHENDLVKRSLYFTPVVREIFKMAPYRGA